MKPRKERNAFKLSGSGHVAKAANLSGSVNTRLADNMSKIFNTSRKELALGRFQLKSMLFKSTKTASNLSI